MVGVPGRSLDHGVERASAELVAQALADDAADERPLLDAALAVRQPLTGADHMEALPVATIQGTVHLLEDVAPFAELAQPPLPVLCEHPAVGRHPIGKA